MRTPSPLERPLRNRIERIWKQQGLFFRSVNDVFAVGVPDVEGIYRGRAWHVEFKAVDGRLEPAQEAWLRAIALNGGVAVECRADLTLPPPQAKFRQHYGTHWGPWTAIQGDEQWIQRLAQ